MLVQWIILSRKNDGIYDIGVVDMPEWDINAIRWSTALSVNG